MATDLKVPDLGDFAEVEVIEVLVGEGDTVAVEDPVITVETDKASMDVPASHAGRIASLKVKVGDKVNSGDVMATVEADENGEASEDGQEEPAQEPANKSREQERSADEPRSGSEAKPAKGEAETEGQGDDEAAQERRERSEKSHKPVMPHSDATHSAELVVIGAGPGGYTAAFRAADLGLRVILVERWPMLGGVCLNVGCIPSKALLHAAKVIDDAAAMGEHGIQFGKPKIDAARLGDWKSKVVGRLTGGLAQLARQRKVAAHRRRPDLHWRGPTRSGGGGSSRGGLRDTTARELPHHRPRLHRTTGAW
jgi:dihydrolipoamide dehydrogenase